MLGSAQALEHGGGGFWTPVSVDRANNLVFVPVGNPAPDFFGSVRQGDNLGINKIVITPMVNWCGTAYRDPTAPTVGVQYYGGKSVQDPIEQARGQVSAMDVSTGEVRWKFDAPAPVLANVTTTAGGITFTADLKGTLYALDSENEKILLRHSLSPSAGGGIITYQLDGKQYVAVVSGPISDFFRSGPSKTKLTLLALS